jgi:hypothetical protein
LTAPYTRGAKSQTAHVKPHWKRTGGGFCASRQWGTAKQERVTKILDRCLQVSLSLPNLVQAYAMIDAHNIAIGRKMGDNDVWIAATAHVMGAILLTTDKGFDTHYCRHEPTFLQRNPTFHHVLRCYPHFCEGIVM